MTTRPSLLLAAKQRTAAFCLSSGNIPKLPAHIEEHISICAHAARRNVALGRQLQSSGWISHHCFTDYHYVFSAAIVLLLNRLVGQETGDPFVPGATSMPSKDEDDINFVIALLSSFGERGNEAATESAKITTELSTIVQRMVFARNQSSSGSSSVGYPNHSPPSAVVGGQYAIVGYPGSQFPHPYGVPGSPGNSLTGSPTPLSPGNSGVEEVCAWLQSGHFDRWPYVLVFGVCFLLHFLPFFPLYSSYFFLLWGFPNLFLVSCAFYSNFMFGNPLGSFVPRPKRNLCQN